MQHGRLITFMSQAIQGKALQLFTYENELMALVLAVKILRPYVLRQTFKVQTDHQSLKYFLEQKVRTLFQQMWLTKLLGCEFLVEYKKGKKNVVVDALSRREEETQAKLLAISIPSTGWLESLKASYEFDLEIKRLMEAYDNGELDSQKYSKKEGLLFYKNRLYIGASSVVQDHIMQLVDNTLLAGHLELYKTLHRARS